MKNEGRVEESTGLEEGNEENLRKQQGREKTQEIETNT